jgi:glycosyltransferase involved in cell wall biosynthesis
MKPDSSGGAALLSSLSFVYPMFNEAENIETAVRESLRIGPRIAREVEIVIVDDASTDGSGEIADRLSREYPGMRVIHHEKNRRLGGALKTGFAAAWKDWILYIDGDLPVDLNEALASLPVAAGADMVIGWRRTRAESVRREVVSKVYNLMIRIVFNLHVRDVNFAFKLFKRSFYEKVHLTSEGSFIDAELLLEMQRAGARIAEIPMNYYPRVAGVSTLSSNAVIFKMLEEMFHYRIFGYAQPNDRSRRQRGRFRPLRQH